MMVYSVTRSRTPKVLIHTSEDADVHSIHNQLLAMFVRAFLE